MIVARPRKFRFVYSEVENVRHKIVEGARLGDPFSSSGNDPSPCFDNTLLQ
jgi:hypothetical protein